jgi:integrase
MPIYKGRRLKTWRVVIWRSGLPNEWIVEGTKDEARAFESRKRVELDAARPTTRTSPSFRDFCESVYQPHAEQHLKASTWSKVRVYQVTTLAAHLGELKLSAITLEDVEAFKRARGAQVKPSSVNNELRVLRTILSYAKAQGYPTSSVTWKPLPVRGQGRVRVWSAEQVTRLFEAARRIEPDLLPILVFLANTGCRKGEALACEWSWIDFPGEMIRIPSNEAWQPKNGMPREVPLSRALKAVLSGPRKHERWLFPTRHGGRYAEFPKDAFAAVRTAAGLVGGPHTLRHTFASLFLASCPDMFLLAQVLGHSHARITELYSHLLPGHLARAKNAVDLGPRTMATTMAKRRRS